MEVMGIVKIFNGRRIVGRNVFTRSFVLGQASNLLCDYLHTETYYGVDWWYTDWTIKLGSDEATPTSYDMVDLVSPYDVAPDDKNCLGVTEVTSEEAEVKLMAKWSPGKVTGRVGEAGLYMRPPNKTTPRWSETYTEQGGSIKFPLVMVARLAAADGKMIAFTPEADKPIIVEWVIYARARRG